MTWRVTVAVMVDSWWLAIFEVSSHWCVELAVRFLQVTCRTHFLLHLLQLLKLLNTLPWLCLLWYKLVIIPHARRLSWALATSWQRWVLVEVRITYVVVFYCLRASVWQLLLQDLIKLKQIRTYRVDRIFAVERPIVTTLLQRLVVFLLWVTTNGLQSVNVECALLSEHWPMHVVVIRVASLTTLAYPLQTLRSFACQTDRFWEWRLVRSVLVYPLAVHANYVLDLSF